MTHIFIVNDQTLKIHLEYLFAGTGCSSDAKFYSDCYYINSRKKDDGITPAAEKNLVAMIADISRIRIGDSIMFYLQANKNHQGMFFGVFKAKSIPFYSPESEKFLNDILGKKLNFRVLIDPFEVYAKGVTEHEALDVLEGVSHPSEMCWSLIYRKLKGNRGCTMITDFEADKLIQKLKSADNQRIVEGNSFSFDKNESEIVASKEKFTYREKKNSLSITDRMLVKSKRNQAFEAHLQAFIIQNIDKSPSGILKKSLKELLISYPDKPFWIGNEVSCGVGMQRIDVMIMQENSDSLYINIAELKCTKPYKEIITEQLKWYSNWIVDYIAPLHKNKNITIVPTIIAKALKNDSELARFKEDCLLFDSYAKDKITISPVNYISFLIKEDGVYFQKVF